MSTEPAQPRHIRSFTLRRGRITEGQQRAVERLMPRYGIGYRCAPLDVRAAFGREAPVIAEIGFGMGETTAAIAAQHPQLNFVGIEVYRAGVGTLLKRIDALRLDNLRVIQHDAAEVVRDMLPSSSLAGVHIFFPDPWPKKRHHKRRLIAPPFVGLLADRLVPGGYLHCATDWSDYAQQMLAVLADEPLLTNLYAAFAPAPVNPLVARPDTKFQTRGERLGHQIRDLVFVRRPADDQRSA